MSVHTTTSRSPNVSQEVAFRQNEASAANVAFVAGISKSLFAIYGCQAEGDVGLAITTEGGLW